MNILITGGAGFIGSHVAEFYGQKNRITIFDNFSRKGNKMNASYISKHFPNVTIVRGDVRNYELIRKYVSKNEVIFHLAGQVAVTTSIRNPREDFESNLLGTLNVLEAARVSKHRPIILDSSTNKVYGDLQGDIHINKNRYIDKTRKKGISENEPLDFYSPYGCSKGGSDQYVHDYYRIFDIPTIVFRQSCIYGTRQFGIEDQGWVAHFIIKAITNKKITIYGTGYQVRDILYIDDLLDAYDRAIKNPNKSKGNIFNIGGGLNNSVSLLELIRILEQKTERKIEVEFRNKRPGDQDVYISNIDKIYKELGWLPKVNIDKGIDRSIRWISENIKAIQKV